MRVKGRSYLHLLQAVYDLVYLVLVVFTSPVLLYLIVTSAKHRAGLARRLGFIPTWPSSKPRIWIHGVSVGEVLAAKNLVEVLDRELPGYEIVISTTTRTGQDVACKHYPGKRVFYYPLDFSWSTRRVLSTVAPKAVILMELEIWPNFLLSTSIQNVPVLLVNGRISEESFLRYKVLQRVIPEPMDRILVYCVQTRRYAERFRRLGVPSERVHVTGTMKFDNIMTDNVDELRTEMRAELGLSPGEKVLMGGSTHPTEEETLFRIYERLLERRPEYRLVLAPRHPERLAEVESMLRRNGVVVVRRTRLRGSAEERCGVILVDTMGELAKLYAAADLVFVGGSLIPHGGQNMIEPAGLGRPVLFGPHVHNFTESVDILLDANAAVMVRSEEELEKTVQMLVSDPERAARMGERARSVVVAHKGASERIMGIIRPFVEGARQAEG